MDYVITMIHGTWATGATWVHKGSPFSTLLEKDLGGTVHFPEFGWNGENSHAARINSAGLLRVHVMRMAREFPEAAQIIIGHSHAGNIALFAAANPDCDKRLSGIITLSTPFIYVQSRVADIDTVRALRTIAEVLAHPVALLYSTILSILAFLLAARRQSLFGVTGPLLDSVAFFLSMAIGWLSFRLYAAGYTKGTRSIESFTIEDVRRLCSAQRRTPVLIVRSPADEANYALSTAGFLSWLLLKMTTAIALGPRRFVEKNKLLVMSWMGGIYIVMLVWAFGFDAYDGYAGNGLIRHPVVDFFAPLGGVLVLSGVLLVLSASMGRWLIRLSFLPMGILRGLVTLAFGRDVGAPSAMLYDVSAEAAPPGGPYEIYTIGASINARRIKNYNAADWMHSETYSDPLAIGQIAAWIKSRRSSGPTM
jgi:hypothetical protein